MFHEIHEDVDGELRTGCSPSQLRRTVEALQAAGRDIVSPREALLRLRDPNGRPFAVLTFDDGYRDNARIALPILKGYGVPMTLFVPTGMVTRELFAWWLGLRDLLKHHENIAIPAMGTTFPCTDLASKIAAMRQVTAWIGTDPGRAAALKETFRHYSVDLPALIERYAMDEAELKAFASHPLVTIGGHTTHHTFLAHLEKEAAYRDIADNKAFLEQLLERPMKYFAYPFGTPGACGEREAQLVQDAGYECAFTTRPGHLFPEHLDFPCMMPREDTGYAHQSQAALHFRLQGTHRAFATRFGPTVATMTS